MDPLAPEPAVQDLQQEHRRLRVAEAVALAVSCHMLCRGFLPELL